MSATVLEKSLQAYGNWHGEMEEIKQRYGWHSVEEVSLFYPPTGHSWCVKLLTLTELVAYTSC